MYYTPRHWVFVTSTEGRHVIGFFPPKDKSVLSCIKVSYPIKETRSVGSTLLVVDEQDKVWQLYLPYQGTSPSLERFLASSGRKYGYCKLG